jgi:RNA polymerase sigma factor (sigma-70 family)
MSGPSVEQDYETYLSGNLPLIRRVVRRVARRHRLSAEDERDLTSVVLVKLISNNYSVLRRFRGQSGLASYLGVVITHAFLDWRSSCWGKWRPSARARRIGPAAVTLERLIDRDGLAAREAFAVVAQEPRWGLSSDAARQLYQQLPIRYRRPRSVPMCDVATPHATDLADRHVDESQVAHRVERARRALRRVLSDLSLEDRRLLTLRFHGERSVADIARITGADQRMLYRRLNRLLGHVRRSLEAHQVTRGEAFELVGHRVAAIDRVLGESNFSLAGSAN